MIDLRTVNSILTESGSKFAAFYPVFSRLNTFSAARPKKGGNYPCVCVLAMNWRGEMFICP